MKRIKISKKSEKLKESCVCCHDDGETCELCSCEEFGKEINKE